MTEQNPPSHEKPRFLARAGRHGNYKTLPDGRQVYVVRDEAAEKDADHGYSDNQFKALRNEPECIGPAILESYREANDFRHSQRHAADVLAAQQLRPLLRAEDRLADAERRAKQAKRRDLKGEFVALRGMLARFQRGGEEPKPGSSVLKRLERVEDSLDGLGEAA